MNQSNRRVSYRLIVKQHRTLDLTLDQFRQLAALGFIRISKRDKKLARLDDRLGARSLNDRTLELFVLEPDLIDPHALQCLLGKWIALIGTPEVEGINITFYRFSNWPRLTDDYEEIKIEDQARRAREKDSERKKLLNIPTSFNRTKTEKFAYRAGYRAGFKGCANLAGIRSGDAVPAYSAGFDKGQADKARRKVTV